jgi:hypothetical protein
MVRQARLESAAINTAGPTGSAPGAENATQRFQVNRRVGRKPESPPLELRPSRRPLPYRVIRLNLDRRRDRDSRAAIRYGRQQPSWSARTCEEMSIC